MQFHHILQESRGCRTCWYISTRWLSQHVQNFYSATTLQHCLSKSGKRLKWRALRLVLSRSTRSLNTSKQTPKNLTMSCHENVTLGSSTRIAYTHFMFPDMLSTIIRYTCLWWPVFGFNISINLIESFASAVETVAHISIIIHKVHIKCQNELQSNWKCHKVGVLGSSNGSETVRLWCEQLKHFKLNGKVTANKSFGKKS